MSWGSHLPRGEDTPGGRGNNPELPADPFSRAQELGLITKLMDPGSDGQRGISFQELAADHAHGQGGGADAAELEAVLRALVELRVVAEDDPKTYRLLAPDGPSAAAGTAPLVRPAGQSYGDEAATTKVVAPKVGTRPPPRAYPLLGPPSRQAAIPA